MMFWKWLKECLHLVFTDYSFWVSHISARTEGRYSTVNIVNSGATSNVLSQVLSDYSSGLDPNGEECYLLKHCLVGLDGTW